MVSIEATIFCFAVFLLNYVSCIPGVWSTREDDWGLNIKLGKEKVSRLHFYFREIPNGNHSTAAMVSPPVKGSSTLFGIAFVVDDLLMEGPERTSRVIGRAQGFYVSTSKEELTLLYGMSLVFTKGRYKGSSLNVFGWNPAKHPVTELPVVGGSGIFRLARGVAMNKPYYYNSTTGEAAHEFRVTVFHF